MRLFPLFFLALACNPPADEPEVTDSDLTDTEVSDTDAEPTDTDTPDTSGPIEIEGTWVDDFGGTHDISASAWVMGTSTFHLVWVDNEANAAAAHNALENEYSPGLFSRFDWFFDGDANLYYCQTRYDAASQTEAQTAAAADSSDLGAGCNGFNWSQLLPQSQM